MTTYLLNTTVNDKILAYIRKNGENEVLVVLNMSKQPINFTIQDENLNGAFKNVFEKTKRNFSEGKDFSFKVSDFAVFEK